MLFGLGEGEPRMQQICWRIKHRILRRRRPFVSKLAGWSLENPESFPWRKSRDPYRILVSEMLLRRTRAPKVAEVYDRFIRKFPSADALANAPISEIKRIIRPLGMVSRSSKMKAAARSIIKNYSSGFPTLEATILSTIGTQSLYATNAIKCFAFDEPVPIFDTNVKRILERVFSLDLGNDAHKKKSSWMIAGLLVPKTSSRQYNLALLDLGRTVCTPSRPRCEICPLNSLCDFAKNPDSERIHVPKSSL
jgi:A/G-specific adenine glycosylase